MMTERIKSLYEQRRCLSKEQHELFIQLMTLHPATDEYVTLRRQYDRLERQADAITNEIAVTTKDRDDEWAFEAVAYYRPSTGILGLLSRPLGPLPKRTTIVNPSHARMREVPGQTFKALATILLALGLVTLMAVFVPLTRISLYSIVAAIAATVVGPQNGPYVALAVCIVLLLVLSNGYKIPAREGAFLNRAAISEEQWFRMGAEKWSVGQRLYSCAAFGFMHVINVIYPLSSLIALSVIGGVFMLAYLREFKRTGSAELATLASTRLHATYNRFGLAFMALSITISVYTTFQR